MLDKLLARLAERKLNRYNKKLSKLLKKRLVIYQ
jgi:hypothetical protein